LSSSKIMSPTSLLVPGLSRSQAPKLLTCQRK